MIKTRSSFFYIDPIDLGNFYLDFDEGSGELTAEIQVGTYTHSDLTSAISNAMNAIGSFTYAVSFDRDSRKFSISSSGSFSLLISSGTHAGNDAFPLLGFTGLDTGFAWSHVANLSSGVEYKPQFWLQDFIDKSDNARAISPAIAKTATGEVEVVKFGMESFFEFNILFATDVPQGDSTFVENDPNGVSGLRDFLNFCIEKNNLEFIPDRDTKSIYSKVLLESTESSKDGTGFRLKELYDKGLPNYFESGKLIFRVRE